MSLMTYLTIASLWIIYLGLHSFLASVKVKFWVENTLKVGPGFYRLVYSLISIFGIGYLFLQMAITPKIVLFDSPGWLKYVAMILASWGVIILVVSFRYLSGLEFLGLKRASTVGLIRQGIHGYVRHPIYSGTILVLVGMFLYNPTDIILVSEVVIFIYLPFGIKWEEQKLIEKYGEAYIQYKEEVSAIIPGII